mmetsp:Transcript_14456/g.35388  ORF Transcript_14456/g.35388 Transcript_14456/m.35388 type:complete len:209 (-) Transcript_14456:128-754(-)
MERLLHWLFLSAQAVGHQWRRRCLNAESQFVAPLSRKHLHTRPVTVCNNDPPISPNGHTKGAIELAIPFAVRPKRAHKRSVPPIHDKAMVVSVRHDDVALSIDSHPHGPSQSFNTLFRLAHHTHKLSQPVDHTHLVELLVSQNQIATIADRHAQRIPEKSPLFRPKSHNARPRPDIIHLQMIGLARKPALETDHALLASKNAHSQTRA